MAEPTETAVTETAVTETAVTILKSVADLEERSRRLVAHMSPEVYGDGFLDEMVTDAKLVEASALNNEGMKAQIEYLVSVGCAGDLEKLIAENSKPENDCGCGFSTDSDSEMDTHIAGHIEAGDYDRPDTLPSEEGL